MVDYTCIRDAVEESTGIPGMAALHKTDRYVSDDLPCGVCCKPWFCIVENAHFLKQMYMYFEVGHRL